MVSPVNRVERVDVVDHEYCDSIAKALPCAESARIPRVKRWFDVSIALVTLVVLAPLMLLIALVIKVDSTGPALFRQERIGQHGRRFHILKFRTLTDRAPSEHHRQYVAAMLADCQAQREAWRATGNVNPVTPFQDPNVTRIGRWLRKTSLDELPQLVNVIRGEMSLVGPRPLPPYEIAGLADWARRRLTAPQGMTGLWQVSGRSALPYLRMLELDLEYVERWSMWNDLVILLKTLRSIFCDWDKTA